MRKNVWLCTFPNVITNISLYTADFITPPPPNSPDVQEKREQFLVENKRHQQNNNNHNKYDKMDKKNIMFI